MRVEDIISLYEDGLDFLVLKGSPRHPRGTYDEGENLIRIYSRSVRDEDDYRITIAHEFIHAAHPDWSEVRTEMTARMLNMNHPEYIDLIMSVFYLPKYHRLPR